MTPRQPFCIRSSRSNPFPIYFFATDTTSRKLDITSLSKAALSPSLMRRLRSCSSLAVNRGYFPIELRNTRTASSAGISFELSSSASPFITRIWFFSRKAKACSTSRLDASHSTTSARDTSSTVSIPLFFPAFINFSSVSMICRLSSIVMHFLLSV